SGRDGADLGERGRETCTLAANGCREHLAGEQISLRVGTEIGHEIEEDETGKQKQGPGATAKARGERSKKQSDRAADEAEYLQSDAANDIRQSDGEYDADDQKARRESRPFGGH